MAISQHRRLAREWALKILYQVEIASQEPQVALEEAVNEEALSPETADFVQMLVMGVLEHKQEIDEKLLKLSNEWALDRQPIIDKNLLRMAAFELLHCPEIPPGATINEAVTLAKKFSTEDSGRFVNGVLGTLNNEFLKALPEEKPEVTL